MRSSPIASVLKRARVRKIQLCSRWLRRLTAIKPAFAVIETVREWPVFRAVLIALIGYCRPFSTLKEAEAAIRDDDGGGHLNEQYLAVKLPEAEAMRPGDYAALFHIEHRLARIHSAFDLGGNVGNLFYAYNNYLDLPADFRWTVCDLPETNALGRQIAAERHEDRLQFTDRLEDADGTDLLMISGALHYFEQTPSDMIAKFATKPQFIIVNRAPLIDGPALATVAEAGKYRLATMLHNRANVVRGLEELGYSLVDSWDIPGRSVIIPCYPDRSAHSYSGLFFQMNRQTGATADTGSTAASRPRTVSREMPTNVA